MKITLSDAMQNAVRWFLSNLHTSAPGFITEFDVSNQTAAVQPSIKRQLTNGDLQQLPVIYNVPIITLKTDSAGLHISPKAGDGVLLVFCERALEVWLSSDQGKIVSPGDVRQYDFTDAVGILGLNPSTFNYPYSDNATYLYNNEGRIKIDDSNKIAIGNDSAELLDILSNTLDKLSTTTAGGTPLDNQAEFLALKNELDLIKGSL